MAETNMLPGPPENKRIVVCLDAKTAMTHAAKMGWGPEDWVLIQSVADSLRYGPVDDSFTDITILGNVGADLPKILNIIAAVTD